MTGAPDVPMDPVVEVRLTVPVAAFVLTFAELMEADEVRLTVLVVAVPTVPASPREPAVAVSVIVEPEMVVPAAEFKLPAAVRLNKLPAPESLVTVVVPATESSIYTSCPALFALAERFGELTVT